MRADIHFWWQLVPLAAKATWFDLGSKRPFWLFLLAVSCVVLAWRAYFAPEQKRWAAIRDQWVRELRDVCVIVGMVGLVFFACEFVWSQPNRIRQQQFVDSLSNPSSAFNPVLTMGPLGPMNAFRSGAGPVCIQVLLPQGFQGGSYKLPFKPVAPSPPTLYNNGAALRKDIDYTVSDSTIVVNFKPASKDSLSVWYTAVEPYPGLVQ